MAAPISSQRDITLDIVKGLCIILMVIGHSGCPREVYRIIYTFHMPCFFIISGMLFREKYVDDASAFIKRRINRLWWSFFKWNLVFLLLHNTFCSLHFYETVFSLKYMTLKTAMFAVGYCCEQLLGGSWFLFSLLEASILATLFFKVAGFTHSKRILGVTVMLVIAFVMLLCSDFSIKLYYSFSYSYVVFEATAYFMVGAIITNLPRPGKIASYIWIFTAVAMSGFLAFWFPYADVLQSTVHTFPIYFIGSCIISFGLVTLCRMLPKISITRKIAWIGVHTLDILIWHFVAFKAVSLMIIHIHGLPLDSLQEFPVIKTYSGLYWMLYALSGVSLSLAMGFALRTLSQTLVPRVNASVSKLKTYIINGGG